MLIIFNFFFLYIIAFTKDRISSKNRSVTDLIRYIYIYDKIIKQSAESRCICLIEKFQCDTIRGLGDVLYLLHAAFIGNCLTDILNIVIPVYGQATLCRNPITVGLQRHLFPSPTSSLLYHYRPRICMIKHTHCSHFYTYLHPP